MPTPKKGSRLGSGPAHQKLMLGGLAASLFQHERIRTTEVKAKALRPVAERLITFAKRGDVAARREVLKVLTDRDIVHRLFADIAPRMADRPGGYTRILKLGPRKGDGAAMAQIELVDQDVEHVERDKAEARRLSTRGLRRRRGGAELEEVDGGQAPEGFQPAEPEAEAAPEPETKKPRRRLRRRKADEE